MARDSRRVGSGLDSSAVSYHSRASSVFQSQPASLERPANPQPPPFSGVLQIPPTFTQLDTQSQTMRGTQGDPPPVLDSWRNLPSLPLPPSRAASRVPTEDDLDTTVLGPAAQAEKEKELGVINMSRWYHLFHHTKNWTNYPAVITQIRSDALRESVMAAPYAWLDAIRGLLDDHDSLDNDYWTEKDRAESLEDQLEEAKAHYESQAQVPSFVDNQQLEKLRQQLQDEAARVSRRDITIGRLNRDLNHHVARLRAERDLLRGKVTTLQEQLFAAQTDLRTRPQPELRFGELHGGARTTPLSPSRGRSPEYRVRSPSPLHEAGCGPSPIQGTPAADQFGRGSMDRHTTVSVGPAYTGKGAKPRPPKEFDGSKREEYTIWKARMKTYLRFTQRQFPTPYDQAEIIASNLEGTAFELVKPYGLLHEGSCRFNTPEAVWKALDDAYLDYDPYAKAEVELTKLTMKPNDSFDDFYSKFLSHAAKMPGADNDAVMISLLKKKISTSLRNKLVYSGQNFTTLAQLVNHLRQVSIEQEALDAERPRTQPNNSGGTRNKNATGDTTVSKGSGNRPGNRRGNRPRDRNDQSDQNADRKGRRPRMTDEEKDKLTKEGRCWKCKNVGHISSDPKCPKYDRDRRDDTVKNNAVSVPKDKESGKGRTTVRPSRENASSSDSSYDSEN